MRWGLLLVVVSIGCEVPSPAPDAGHAVDSGVPLQTTPPCLQVTTSAIDFGETELSVIGSERIEITNNSRQVRSLTSNVPGAPFEVSPPLQLFPMTMPGLSKRVVEIVFRPTDSLLHLASVRLSMGPDCEATIALRGLGSGAVQFVPQVLDFGFLQPHQQKTMEVQLVNTRRTDVHVSRLTLESATPLWAFTSNLPSELDLPPLSSTTFSVTADPPTDLTFGASLVAITPFGNAESRMTVVGGVPVAELAPRAMQVPIVAFFPGFRGPNFSERLVRVRNVGTLGQSLGSALRLVPPFVRVESVDGGVADELEVSLPAGVLQEGIAHGEELELPLRLTPTEPGPRDYRVKIFTNDPVNPEQVVTFAANVETSAPCVMRVQPDDELVLTGTADGLSHGVISFINEGPGRCVVDDIRLEASTPSTFRLLVTDAQLVVAPGQTGTIELEGPRTLFENTGQVGFHVFNPSSGRQAVTLRAPP